MSAPSIKKKSLYRLFSVLLSDPLSKDCGMMSTGGGLVTAWFTFISRIARLHAAGETLSLRYLTRFDLRPCSSLQPYFLSLCGDSPVSALSGWRVFKRSYCGDYAPWIPLGPCLTLCTYYSISRSLCQALFSDFFVHGNLENLPSCE